MTWTEIIESTDTHRVRLELDDDRENTNPRFDRDTNLTHVVTVPSRGWPHYADVDIDGGPLADAWHRALRADNPMDLFERHVKIFYGGTTERFTPHDGPNSVWYVLPEQMAETGPGVTPQQVLHTEMEEYQRWLDGEVYGWIIEKATVWNHLNTDTGEDMDTTEWEEVEGGSRWGYIGREYAETTAREEFAAYIESIKKED